MRLWNWRNWLIDGPPLQLPAAGHCCLLPRPLANRRPHPWLTPRKDWMLSCVILISSWAKPIWVGQGRAELNWARGFFLNLAQTQLKGVCLNDYISWICKTALTRLNMPKDTATAADPDQTLIKSRYLRLTSTDQSGSNKALSLWAEFKR